MTPAPAESRPADGDRARTRPATLPQKLEGQLLNLIAASTGPELVLPPERQLAEELGVSRNVLREAFSALVSSGVVSQRGKLRVADTARARRRLVAATREAAPGREHDDPLEARWALEPEVAALAARRAVPAAIEEAERWLQLMRESLARGGARAVEYDSAFHVAIARAADNHTLVDLLTGLTEELTTTRELSFHPSAAGHGAVAEHAEVLAAIRARDPEHARRAMRHHLEQVRARVREALGEDADAASDGR